MFRHSTVRSARPRSRRWPPAWPLGGATRSGRCHLSKSGRPTAGPRPPPPPWPPSSARPSIRSPRPILTWPQPRARLGARPPAASGIARGAEASNLPGLRCGYPLPGAMFIGYRSALQRSELGRRQWREQQRIRAGPPSRTPASGSRDRTDPIRGKTSLPWSSSPARANLGEMIAARGLAVRPELDAGGGPAGGGPRKIAGEPPTAPLIPTVGLQAGAGYLGPVEPAIPL